MDAWDIGSRPKGIPIMTDDEKDDLEIFLIRELSAPPETTVTPADDSDIFAIKKANADRLGSLIGVALGEGVFLCNAYRLDKRISRDETGEIWKASDLQESRNVTVYLPPPEIRKEESAIESVRKNANRLEALDHPHIIPTLKSLTDPEHGFFTVRKWIGDNTLDTHWQEYGKKHKKPASLNAVKILTGIAHALDYAHRADIIHGNLCPKNITVGRGGEVYIDNFAILPLQAEKASPERKPYLSPEVLEGKAATVHSDIYSLAVIAYELLSGRLPDSPESMGTLLPIPHAPSAVDAVIRKALEKIPEDRYDICGAFVKALESAFQEPQKSRPVKVSSSSKPSIKKIVTTVLLWGLALAFFSTGFYGFVHFDDVQSTLADIAQNPGSTLAESLPQEEETTIFAFPLLRQDWGTLDFDVLCENVAYNNGTPTSSSEIRFMFPESAPRFSVTVQTNPSGVHGVVCWHWGMFKIRGLATVGNPPHPNIKQ